jgi:hypothetical protein
MPSDDKSKLATKINNENKIDEKWEEIRQKTHYLKQSRELNMKVSGCVSTENLLNCSGKVNDTQRVKQRPEHEPSQGEKQTVKYRMKQNLSNGRQSRSAEIKQL